MAPEDMEKTTFVTLWGTFCYKVMSFGLKNIGAIYQRAMVALFHDMMHREIEVYVDHMIVKSKIEEEHLVNLRKLNGEELLGVKIQELQKLEKLIRKGLARVSKAKVCSVPFCSL